MKPSAILSFAFAAGIFVLTGCQGIPTSGEKSARRDLGAVAGKYRPDSQPPKLPELTPDSDLSNYLAFALLNSPTIAATFYDWSASVENITVARSLPDPKLTFQAYIQDSLTSLMPGLIQDLPGPGKLKTAARVATAASQVKYFAFESAVLQTAFDVKSSCYNLYFLDEQLRVHHQTHALLAQLAALARSQNEVGKGTLPDVYRAEIERDQHLTDIANMEDSRGLLLAQFKAALGLTRDQPDPPVPAKFEGTPLDVNADDLLATAFTRNPRLKELEADVQMAEAAVAQARKSNVPDFSAGLQAEVYEPPFYWPQASMTLPVWRDKIAAQIAAAQNAKRAAAARLTAGQISLTVDFALRTYDYRESTRNLALLENRVIPRARLALEIARAGYVSGQVDFSKLFEAERALLDYQLQEIQERERREIALANLSLLIAGVPPENSPLLKTETSTR